MPTKKKVKSVRIVRGAVGTEQCSFTSLKRVFVAPLTTGEVNFNEYGEPDSYVIELCYLQFAKLTGYKLKPGEEVIIDFAP